MLQSGHLTICFNLSTFTGAGSSSTIGSSTTASSTGCFVILIFGLALDFDFGFALGLISSSIIASLIYSLISSLIGSSFTGSSLLIIYII